MGENGSDDIQKRGRINPEHAAMAGIVDCARVLFSFAKGGSNFIETPNWTVEPYSGVSGAANLIHHPGRREMGEYTFLLKTLPDAIVMENYHRRARLGSGVSAFSDLEHMAAALATMAGKNVQTVYPLFGQRDTEKFLLARGYGIISVDSLPALEQTFPPLQR